MWKILESGAQSAQENMKRDSKLLREMKEGDSPILHFYEFQRPSFTFGMFLAPEKHLDMKEVEGHFDFSRRATGGGILFHPWDFTFSVFVPKSHPRFGVDTMENYKTIHQALIHALQEFDRKDSPFSLLPEDPIPMDEASRHFCFAKPTKYDVMCCGKKIAGAAQRRSRQGILHQGSISLAMPSFHYLEKFIPKDTRVIDAMKTHTEALLPKKHTAEDMKTAREDLKGHLLKSFESL